MKKILVLLSIFYSFSVNAQNRILFSYDGLGNQIRRVICLNCTTSKIVSPSELTDADLIKSDVSDQISYYPNPVREELYVKWTLIDEKKVENISVYNMTGILLKQFNNLNADTLQAIPFSGYPEGMYEVVLIYNNGEKKALKILKK